MALSQNVLQLKKDHVGAIKFCPEHCWLMLTIRTTLFIKIYIILHRHLSRFGHLAH